MCGGMVVVVIVVVTAVVAVAAVMAATAVVAVTAVMAVTVVPFDWRTRRGQAWQAVLGILLPHLYRWFQSLLYTMDPQYPLERR